MASLRVGIVLSAVDRATAPLKGLSLSTAETRAALGKFGDQASNSGKARDPGWLEFASWSNPTCQSQDPVPAVRSQPDSERGFQRVYLDAPVPARSPASVWMD